MRSDKRLVQRVLGPALGIVIGSAAGLATVAWPAAEAGRTNAEAQAVLDATHFPPLLTVPGEPREVAYDVHCAAAESEHADTGCHARGTVFVRPVGDGPFAALPLHRRSMDGGRQLAAIVPDDLASARGFEYYAVLEAIELDQRVVLPAGGADAPHVSRPVGAAVDVELGRHVFGGDRRTGTRVAAAGWGDGATRVGLEHGPTLDPIGASAFDVDPQGGVVVLDQAHRRLLRWRRNAGRPESVQLSVNGTIADMTLAGDGSVFVLETTAEPGRNPLVRRFDGGGREVETIEVAERTPSQIRMDSEGPVVLGGPSHHWAPLFVDGTPATPAEQRKRGRPGRRIAGGGELVVLRRANEIRVASVSGQTITRSWRLTSDTPLAEVQLAEPLGHQVVLVVRVYEEGRGDEFAVVILGRGGLVDRFNLESADWAETAPLARFRLAGRSLYRLGSTSAGAFVDRYDLEVR